MLTKELDYGEMMKIVMATGTFDIIHPGHIYYLEESKKLGGIDSKLVVVLARDITVRAKKRIPIVNEKQRLEVVKMLKPVDNAYLGSKTDMFKIVKEIDPDIITLGPDQKFEIEFLEEQLKSRNLKAEVKRIKDFKEFPLNSTCKIIKKIKSMDFDDNIFKDC
ncbi:MAG: adenylyltransferase/cytidyltransferase family protein [Methanobacteriaceae archaeon]